MLSIILKPLYHRKQESIGIYCTLNAVLNNLIKIVPDVRWSRTHGCWYIPLDRKHYMQLLQSVGNKAAVNNQSLVVYLQQRKAVILQTDKPVSKPTVTLITTYPLHQHNLKALTDYKNMLLLKAYSSNTIRNYCNAFHHLLRLLHQIHVADLTKTQIMSYLLWLITKQGYKEMHVHVTINAIKFYFEKVLGRQAEFYDIPRPKKPFKLPEILAGEEVSNLIQKVENLKHRAMLMTGYSAGLRVSEIVSLTVKDIDSKRMMIHIHGAKGKKDRMVPLSKKLLLTLREYFLQYKPKSYLFEGQYGGAYSTRSVQLILIAAKKKAGITKKGSVHSLRHSYATHLMESGTDIRFIQDLLGHNSIKTTMRYTHVSKREIGKIESPLDKLNL